MKRIAVVLVALTLTACAQQQPVPRTQAGLWHDWRSMAANQFSLLPAVRQIPEVPRAEYIDCAVDAMIPYYTADELRRLDRHANGAQFMSDDELRAIEKRHAARLEADGGMEWQMNKRCPETMQQAASGWGQS